MWYKRVTSEEYNNIQPLKKNICEKNNAHLHKTLNLSMNLVVYCMFGKFEKRICNYKGSSYSFFKVTHYQFRLEKTILI